MNYCNWLFDTKDKDLEREIIIDWETGKRLTRLANFLKSKGFFWPPNISDVLFALWIRFLRRTMLKTPVPNV